MRRLHIPALVCAIILAAMSGAHAEPTERDSLLRVLSMLTGGWVDPTDPANSVTVVGDDGSIGIPATGTAATITARLRRSASGAWDLLSVAMPDDLSAPSGPDNSRQLIIGQQQTHGRLDPSLTTPSELHAALKDLTFTQIHGETHAVSLTNATTIDSRLTQAAAGHVELHGTSASTGYSLKLSNTKGSVIDAAVPHVQAEAAAFDIDPNRFPALAHAFHEIRTNPNDIQDGIADFLETLSAATHRITGQEQIDSAIFTLASGTQGKLGSTQFGFEAVTANDHLTASVATKVDGLEIASAAPTALAEFVPHHIAVSERVIGVPIPALVSLLRDAGKTGKDRNAVRQEALRFVATSGAKFAIDALDFDSGPLRVHGNGQFFTASDGQAAMQMRVRATGLDALLAQAQTNPSLQHITPALFMAKGMGRADGDGLIWDIVLDHGALTVNGIPLGHPPGIPGALPPATSPPVMSPPTRR